MKLQSHARMQGVAQKVQASRFFSGIDFVTILKILETVLPVIIRCFAPSDGVEAQRYVAKRWNAADKNNRYGGYDKRLVKATARQVIQTAWRDNRLRLTWDQAYDMSLRLLDDIREGDTSQASIVINENLDFNLI